MKIYLVVKETRGRLGLHLKKGDILKSFPNNHNFTVLNRDYNNFSWPWAGLINLIDYGYVIEGNENIKFWLIF